MPVNIHGKQYRTVAERIELFHKEHKKDIKSITTEILKNDENIVLMKTTIKVGDNIYEGYNQETYGSSHINKTSALENCETSAIGRALSSAGFVGEEFASANEVQNAIKQQKNGVSVRPKSSKPKLFVKKDVQKPLDWNEEMRNRKLGFGKNKELTWKSLEDKFLDWIIKNMSNEKILSYANAEKILRTTEKINSESSKKTEPKVIKEKAIDELFPETSKHNPSKEEADGMAINQPDYLSEEEEKRQWKEFENA
tara:strand:+ start:1242 stop:2003 length:762 start_codon:yes stop_codon:yes gene_type:complete